MIYCGEKKKKTLKGYIRFAYEYLKCRYNTLRLKKTNVREWGVTQNKRECQIVVSLTSYPARIAMVSECIKTLLNQTVKPDHIFLSLAKEQFPNNEEDLPQNLLELKKYGLEIIWCDDCKSYKKLVPIYEKWKAHIIVTADDDNYYSPNWLELLLKGYEEYPSCIQCNVVTKFSFDCDRNFYWIPGGREFYTGPSFLNKLVGCGGVLYPPNSLYKDIDNSDLFMKLAPTNDDQWFWIMAVLAGTKIRVVDNYDLWNKEIAGTKKSGLTLINDRGERLFVKQLENILNYYPNVIDIMYAEYEERGNK